MSKPSKKPEFFFYGFDGIEYKTIRNILESEDIPHVDLGEMIQVLTNAEISGFIRESLESGIPCYFMPNFPLRQFYGTDEPYAKYAIPLERQEGRDGLSILAQVCAIVGHESNLYQTAVSVYAHGHIPAMRDQRFNFDLIKQVAHRDRLIRGGTLKDEADAIAILDSVKPIDQNDDFLTYEADYEAEGDHDDALRRSSVRLSIAHRAMLRAATPETVVTVIFNLCDKDGYVLQTDILSSDIIGCESVAHHLDIIGYQCEYNRRPFGRFHLIRYRHDGKKGCRPTRDRFSRHLGDPKRILV